MPGMGVLQQWARQPQRVWLRRALFQIHLWTGIGVGLYVLMISVTGSVLVYRVELVRNLAPQPDAAAAAKGTPLSEAQLTEAAKRVYPGYEVTEVVRARRKTLPTEITLTRGSETKQRAFDTYTGKDLGNANPVSLTVLNWILDLHDNLLAGSNGRWWNGVFGLLLTLLALTGIVIWWPGVQSWRKSLTFRWKTSWKRFNWDLHSAVGFWTLLFTLLFAFTGVYLGFPEAFGDFVDYVQPTSKYPEPRLGDNVLFWLARLHFGRFAGQPVKAIWAIFGLVPAVLFVTGFFMWWNRVVRPALNRTKQTAAQRTA
jgi:uncharacterized iron-regulated membrane protein